MQDSITPELIDEFVPALKGYADCAGTDGFAINAACLMLETIADKLRTGQLTLAQPTGDEVEAVARKLAPFLEGGREYDQMPATRRELKIWSRNGMALINDATQDDALEAAQAAITALKAKEQSDG